MGNVMLVALYRISSLFAAANGASSNAACQPGKTKGVSGFFGFPTWYKYLKNVTTQSNLLTSSNKDVCTPYIGSITDFLLIGLAVLEMLIRVASLVAIVFVVYGGFKYITSQAEPDKLKAARATIINAMIGLVITVGATAVITFIAGKF